jgi:hypothetical protein
MYNEFNVSIIRPGRGCQCGYFNKYLLIGFDLNGNLPEIMYNIGV